MKVLYVIALAFACVAARGSGPYLPSGWKPDGPAFYLPSDISKPIKEPVKEVIFSESEPSGSDFLREYGPPKVQEVSQDISQQALPDVLNEQLFIAPVVESNDTKEKSNVVTEVAEEKLEVLAEVKAADEPLAITEPQEVTVTESIINIEEEDLQLKDETTTLANVVKSVDAVDVFGYLVEPTVAVEVQTEKITIEASVQSQNQMIADTVAQTKEEKSEQQEIVQSDRQEEKSENIDTVLITSEAKQSRIDVSNEAESSNIESSEVSSVTQNTDFDIISTVEEKIGTVEKEVKKIEEVVQNIPELIVSLENEVKSQQAETIQVTPAVIQELFGSLDQAPEGFLEYGPPGFSEYGPPKEDLTDNPNEEKIPEARAIDNFVRRRRFSPKFRFFRISH